VLLAGNMLTAIAVSGFGEGEVLPSLTLAPAPALLAIMLALLVVGLRGGGARPRAACAQPLVMSQVLVPIFRPPQFAVCE